MGIDVCVYNNDCIIPTTYFTELGFPSDNLRNFGISGGWIPYFEDLVGIKNCKYNINYYASTLKKVDNELMIKWYDYIINNGKQNDIISKYLKLIIDEKFTLLFW